MQARDLMSKGELVITKDDCSLRYFLSEKKITFHVKRKRNNTSATADMPISQEFQARLEKIITVFAQSEAVAKV